MSLRGEGVINMKRIAIINSQFVRDTQVFTGNPVVKTIYNPEDQFADLKYPCHFIGIFIGENCKDIKIKAASSLGVDPNIITLIKI